MHYWQSYWIYRPAGVWRYNWTEIPTFVRALRHTPDLSKTGHSLRRLFISDLEGESKCIDLKPPIVLVQLTVWISGINEVPKSIRQVSSTIQVLDLTNNCITTLEYMGNISFRNLEMASRAKLLLSLEPYVFATTALSHMALSENRLTHLGDMSTCQWGLGNERSGFVMVSLRNNPGHFNGFMLWLQIYLCNDPTKMSAYYIRQPQGLIIDTSQFTCHSSVEFEGRAFLALNESALNKLDICSNGEYCSVQGFSVRWFCVLYESPDYIGDKINFYKSQIRISSINNRRYLWKSHEACVIKVPKFRNDTFSMCTFATSGLLPWNKLSKELGSCREIKVF